jgi:CheY-like chemotaxis protein
MKTPLETVVPKRILVVDDDADILDMIVRLLKQEGYIVTGACSYAEFEEAFSQPLLPNLILLDIRLPVHDGFWIAQNVRAKYNIPIIFITAHDCAKYRLYAPMMGAADYVQKPFEPKQLLNTVTKVLGCDTPSALSRDEHRKAGFEIYMDCIPVIARDALGATARRRDPAPDCADPGKAFAVDKNLSKRATAELTEQIVAGLAETGLDSPIKIAEK